ncbi:hypothetical protein, partial [Kurthia gibsonii]|uniref:hypothetical protein n=1 Tax=Kurthia gibsonii TaxID=33946 RepID=UPI0031B6CA5E
GRMNVPNQCASDPTTLTNAPFCHPNGRNPPHQTNLSPESLIKVLANGFQQMYNEVKLIIGLSE